jgi:MATE family multidrug resistance protein
MKHEDTFRQYKTVLKQLVALALPIVFSNIISASSGLISMLFIASINQNALAAGAIITSTYGLITVMVISVLYSVSILIAQSHGSRRDDEVSPIIFSGITIAFLLGAPLTGVLCFMTPILQFLHQPTEVSQLAGQYFQGIAYGLIPSLIGAVFTQFFMGISKAKLLLYFTILGVVVNILMSYVFIFGVNTLQPRGVFGAGLASSITSYMLLAALLVYVFCNSEFKKYRMISKNTFTLSYCKLLLKIGTPISIQYTLELFAFSIITYLMGLIGTNALGAQQITLQCSMVAIMVVMGFSQSGSILISQSLGKGKTPSDRKMIANSTFGVGSLCMLGIGLVYWIFPDTLIALYLDIQDPALSEIVSLARTILYIAAFTQLFDAGRNISAGLLRGFGDTKSSMWTSLISCWVIGLPLAILFAFGLHFDAIGLRIGIMFGIVFGCIHLINRLDKINNQPYISPFYHNIKKLYD